MYDGSSCFVCQGTGIIMHGPPNPFRFEIEWKSDRWEIVGGDPLVCELCGHEFFTEVEEEVDKYGYRLG